MKRGNVRTTKKYTTDESGNKIIKWEIQGKFNGIWRTIHEVNKESKKKVPMIYNSQKEAENELLKIVKQIKRR